MLVQPSMQFTTLKVTDVTNTYKLAAMADKTSAGNGELGKPWEIPQLPPLGPVFPCPTPSLSFPHHAVSWPPRFRANHPSTVATEPTHTFQQAPMLSLSPPRTSSRLPTSTKVRWQKGWEATGSGDSLWNGQRRKRKERNGKRWEGKGAIGA